MGHFYERPWSFLRSFLLVTVSTLYEQEMNVHTEMITMSWASSWTTSVVREIWSLVFKNVLLVDSSSSQTAVAWENISPSFSWVALGNWVMQPSCSNTWYITEEMIEPVLVRLCETVMTFAMIKKLRNMRRKLLRIQLKANNSHYVVEVHWFMVSQRMSSMIALDRRNETGFYRELDQPFQRVRRILEMRRLWARTS